MRSGQVLLLVFVLAAAFLLLSQSGALPSFSVVSSDAVWCSEWIGIGCGIREEANKTAFLNTSDTRPTASFTCDYDRGCEIEAVSALNFDSCGTWGVEKNGVIVNRFNQNSLSETNAFFRGLFIQQGGTLGIKCSSLWPLASGYSHFNFTYTGKKLRLAYCSSGPTASSCDAGTSGVEILGADGCHYNVGDRPGATDSAILDQAGAVIGQAHSFPVPESSNVWVPNPTKSYVCGTTADQCQADSGCHYKYPFSWPIGSGLGNADIVGGKVVVYGCTATGAEKCSSWSGTTEGSGTCLEQRRSNRCAIVQDDVMRAECNPLTSTCGSNAFCDPDTLRCVPTGTVQCGYERDPVCGTTVQCDRATKTMKEPYCRNPGTVDSACEFRTLQSIQCCGSSDCGIGFFCTADRKCEKQELTIQECPFTCCEGDPTVTGYWENVPVGKHCCPDHTQIVDDLSQCGAFRCIDDSDCLRNERCVDGECVDATLCSERDAIPPFIVGWKTVVTDTPVYLLGWIPIQVGVTTAETCVEVYDWGLIAIIIIAIIGSLALVYFLKKK